MEWSTYERKFRKAASAKLTEERIDQLLNYARQLNNADLPIIYDQHHLCLLIGINDEYLHRMSNSPVHFYRTFYITKKNGNADG